MSSWLFKRILQSPLFNVLMAIRHPRIPINYWRYIRQPNKPRVADLETTLKTIVDRRLSVSRFGDGELRWMIGADSYSFQSGSKLLAERLQSVMTTPAPPNLAVCIPDVFNGLSPYVPQNKNAWMELLGQEFNQWWPYLKHQPWFYDANLSRFYIDRRDKKRAGHYFALLKRLWAQRDVLIVEGEQTRLGSGNDLLAGAQTIRRVICPGRDAFGVYSQIMAAVQKHATKGDLILLALGPTATVLAADLAELGYQAVDIGHADLEYQWYRQGVKQRVAIANRHVEEVAQDATCSNHDPQYQHEIVVTVKGE